MKRSTAFLSLQLALLLFLLLPDPCRAETLFHRSNALLQANLVKASPDDYTFAVLGDSRDGEEKFKKVLRLARSFSPLFILHQGDYSNNGSQKETAEFLSVVEKEVPGIPLFVVMGNHEDPKVFQRMVGPTNFTLSSSHLKFTLIGLDNSEGSLRRQEQDYLRAKLTSSSGAVFVAMHIPPKTARWRQHTFTEGVGELEGILKNSGIQALFTGHVHLYDRSEFAGIPAFITGGAGSPSHWYKGYGEPVDHILVVRVKKGRASFEMVPLR